MATFETQVEALTGISIDGSSSPTQTELSVFLQDGVKDVIHRMIEVKPGELARFTSTTNSTSSIAKVGAILSVVREHDSTDILRKCTAIDPGDRYEATDVDSLLYRSKTNPGYYELAGSIHTVPQAASGNNDIVVTQLFYDTGVAYGDEVPDNFPESYAYLVAIYAAIQSLHNKMANTSISALSINTVPPDVPSAPSFSYSTASYTETSYVNAEDDTSLDSTIGAITDLEGLGSAPTYTAPTTTISGVAWATEYPSRVSDITTALGLIKTAVDQAATAAGKFLFDASDSVFGDEATFLTADSQLTRVKDALDNAEKIIDDGVNSPTGNAAGDAATYLYTDEDTELLNGAINIASSEINRARAHLSEWAAIGDMRVKEVDVALKEADGYAKEVQALLSATSPKVSEYTAKVQDALNEFNEANVKYQAEIKEHLQESANEVTRVTTIYNRVSDINLQNAQNTANIGLTTKSKTADIDLQNKINTYRASVDEYTQKLSRYSTEISAYNADVGREVQEYSANIQKDTTNYTWSQGQMLKLQAQYDKVFTLPGEGE